MPARVRTSSGVIGLAICAGILGGFLAACRQRLAFFVLDLAVPMRD
jgi:hypothetical protein